MAVPSPMQKSQVLAARPQDDDLLQCRETPAGSADFQVGWGDIPVAMSTSRTFRWWSDSFLCRHLSCKLPSRRGSMIRTRRFPAQAVGVKCLPQQWRRTGNALTIPLRRALTPVAWPRYIRPLLRLGSHLRICNSSRRARSRDLLRTCRMRFPRG